MTAVLEPQHRSFVEGPWTTVPAAPFRPVHARVARALFRRVVGGLPIRVRMPDGTQVGDGSEFDPLITIHRDEFFHRLGADGLIGFGESYMVGDWDANDLAAALEPFAARIAQLLPAWMQHLRNVYVQHRPSTEANTRPGARRNIARHYDLSNELFACFLDDSMTYSAARFEPGDTLERAQLRKIDHLLDGARVGNGSRVLEIGTGWGALAVRAVQRGASVVSVTLSREQQAAAIARAREAGVEHLVDVRLADYREVHGTYDAVVSVEMIEAVGSDFWPMYFETVDRLLVPGGRFALQSILMQHDRMLVTRDQQSWIHSYIFPGGEIPSERAIADIVRDRTAMRIVDRDRFGLDYARTLHEWDDRFAAASTRVAALGFDERFRRMWHFYLAYCEAGFATRYLDVAQYVMEKDQV